MKVSRVEHMKTNFVNALTSLDQTIGATKIHERRGATLPRGGHEGTSIWDDGPTSARRNT